ncbi:ubiquitin family protein [Ceratobasidium sp. AG-Ba]|nr:ubiquitin family protein [Ceratobasidium sp. AG-Ba]
MSNSADNAEAAYLPYYVARYKGRTVVIKRDPDYQATIQLIQDSKLSIPPTESHKIVLSASFAFYGNIRAQVSEEMWPDVVKDVKTLEVTLEGNYDSEDTAVRPSRIKNSGVTPKRSSVNQDGSYSITLRTTYRELITLDDISETTTVQGAKSLIETKYGIPTVLQQLVLSDVQLDDDLKLIETEATAGEPVDLVLATRETIIYVLAAQPDRRGITELRDAQVELFVDRQWDYAAFGDSPDLSEHRTQYRSWVVSVLEDSATVNQVSGSEVYCLHWDGSPSYLFSIPESHSEANQSPEWPEPIEAYRSMLAIRFDNSVAVPLSNVEHYVSRVFKSFYIDRTDILSYFLSQLNSKSYSHVAIRFLKQTEYQQCARLSIVDQPSAKVVHIVLLYKSIDPEIVPFWNSAPPHQTSYQDGWREVIDPDKILQKPYPSDPIVVDFTFMEVP